MPILVSGSLVYDSIMDFPDRFKNHIFPENIHILNVCFTVNKLGKSKGGTAGNIAYNVKMLGADPIIVSTVGRDGGEYIDYLKKLGISTAFVKTDKKYYSASCHITTDLDDNQVTAFYNGALDSVPGVNFKKLSARMPRWAIAAPTNKGAMLKHLRECAKFGIKTIFDPGQVTTYFGKDELKSSIRRADIVIGNDYEIKTIQKKTGWGEKEIIARAGVLIITLGAKGSVIKTSRGEIIKIKAARLKKMEDPTGAGDAYRAGLLVGLDKGLELGLCGQMASVTASFAVEKYGTQEHWFSKKEFKERHKQTFGGK